MRMYLVDEVETGSWCEAVEHTQRFLDGIAGQINKDFTVTADGIERGDPSRYILDQREQVTSFTRLPSVR